MSKLIFALLTSLIMPWMGSTILAQQPVGQANPSRIGRIYIKGNENVPEATILGRFGLYPGQQYRAADLRTAETNLARSKLFTHAKITVPNPNCEYHDIVIDVTESSLGKVVGRVLALREQCTSAAIDAIFVAAGFWVFR